MKVDGGGFPAGVGEDRRVEGRDAAVQGQQQKRRALYAGTE
jgi:hypothetical protein